MTKDWALHKKRIIQLYKMEGMTLEQVREHMIRERNFKAGIRTYRIYLQKWNVRKYKQRSYHAAPSSRGVHQLPAQPPSEKLAETIPAFDTHQRILPAPRVIPWLETPDAFHPTAWPTRSPSTVASEYVGSPAHNDHFMEPPVLPASPSVASEYVGSPAHDGHFMKSVLAMPAMSEGGYLAVPEQMKREQTRGEFPCYYPSGSVWGNQGY